MLRMTYTCLAQGFRLPVAIVAAVLLCGFSALSHASDSVADAWTPSDPTALLEQLPGRHQGSPAVKQPGVCVATLLDGQDRVVGFVEAGAAHLSYKTATGTLETLWVTGESALAEYSSSLPGGRRLSLTLLDFPARSRTAAVRATLTVSAPGTSAPLTKVERQLTVDDRCSTRVTGSPRRSSFSALLQWLAH